MHAQALQHLRASTQVQDLADVRERMATGLRALDAHGAHAQYGAGACGDGDAAFLGAAVVKTVEAVGRMQAAGAACARHTPEGMMWVQIYGLRRSCTYEHLVTGVSGHLRDSSRSQMLQITSAPEAASYLALQISKYGHPCPLLDKHTCIRLAGSQRHSRRRSLQ